MISQNETTPFLVTDSKNLTLIDATRENSPWCPAKGVPPRAGKPGKALFNSVNGDHLATLGLGTPIRQGVNCSEIFIKFYLSIIYY